MSKRRKQKAHRRLHSAGPGKSKRPLGNGNLALMETFEVTWEPIPAPEVECLPEAVKKRMEVLYGQVNHPSEATIRELRDLSAAHPDVICFQNWLSAAYRRLGRNEEALDVIGSLIRTHPDYFFGRMALVEMMIETGDAVAAEQLLFEKGRSLPHMYPDRKQFHISEVRVWLTLCCKIHIMHGNLAAARSLRDVLATMEPDSPAVDDLDGLLRPRVPSCSG